MRAAWSRYFSSGIVEFDTQIVAILCREMRWDFEQYLSQPLWFIFMLLELLRAETLHAKSKL